MAQLLRGSVQRRLAAAVQVQGLAAVTAAEEQQQHQQQLPPQPYTHSKARVSNTVVIFCL